MPRILLCISLLAGCATAVDAQDTLRSNVGFGLGYHHQSFKHDIFSPLVHTGSSFVLMVSYRKETEQRKSHLQIDYNSFSLSSEVGSLSTTGHQGLIQTSYHWRTGSLGQFADLFVGGVFDARVSVRNSIFVYGQTQGNNDTGEIISSLSPSVLAERKMGGDRVSIQLWVSLLSFIVSPGYAQSYPPDMYFTSLNNLFRAQARMSYVRSLSERMSARIDGQFDYLNLTKNDPVRSLNMSLVFSLAYRFR